MHSQQALLRTSPPYPSTPCTHAHPAQLRPHPCCSFGKELFTDAGKYVLHFGSPAEEAAQQLANTIHVGGADGRGLKGCCGCGCVGVLWHQ